MPARIALGLIRTGGHIGSRYGGAETPPGFDASRIRLRAAWSRDRRSLRPPSCASLPAKGSPAGRRRLGSGHRRCFDVGGIHWSVSKVAGFTGVGLVDHVSLASVTSVR